MKPCLYSTFNWGVIKVPVCESVCQVITSTRLVLESWVDDIYIFPWTVSFFSPFTSILIPSPACKQCFQQCSIFMKAFLNSMLNVVYIMGLIALFTYPNQVKALYISMGTKQVVQWVFRMCVMKNGSQQMMNTPAGHIRGRQITQLSLHFCVHGCDFGQRDH